VFNNDLNNISVISWRKTKVLRDNIPPATKSLKNPIAKLYVENLAKSRNKNYSFSSDRH